MKNVNSKITFYFLLGLIILRPSFDILSQKEFQIHPSLPHLSLNIIIGGLIFFWGLFFILKNVKSISQTPLFYPITTFLLLIFASVFYSFDFNLSLKEFIRIASIFFLYFIAYLIIKNRQQWQLLIKAILISYFLPGLFAFFQLITKSGTVDQFGSFQRVYGTFNHTNPFAFYTFFILALFISLLLIRKEFKSEENKYFIFSPIFLWLMTTVLIFLLFITYTRSALICLMIFAFIIGLLKYRRIILIGLALFAIAYLFSGVFQERFWQIFSLDPYGSIVWRFRLWSDMLPVAFWQPWFGHGVDTFDQLAGFYRGFAWGSLEAHNDYLKIFLENGFFGLVAYLWLILTLLFYLFRSFRENTKQEKIIGLSILLISLTLSIAGFFDNILRTTALQWNLWILIGAWLKVNSFPKEDK